MQTHCGIHVTKVPVRKLSMFEVKPSDLLLTSKEDVASVMLTLNYSLKLLQAGKETTN